MRARLPTFPPISSYCFPCSLRLSLSFRFRSIHLPNCFHVCVASVIIHFYWTLDLASNYLPVVQVPPFVFCLLYCYLCPRATILFAYIVFQ
ncbi:hypothetical protein HYPSUDRAFT_868372 [Hypholoma sublateritium FD-334 SS-4]|uniref:Uncharacterized protein n=1 Tax=Hypholoma sublateritium (strain FD-334 SS-4) TaxID=945553 RepID=A0A0D2Q7K0_HYPSF|nr:hypothetical protein HYPSUDRAFT_868372 [Hypholoma sublateritium FD-334 SS-4]